MKPIHAVAIILMIVSLLSAACDNPADDNSNNNPVEIDSSQIALNVLNNGRLGNPFVYGMLFTEPGHTDEDLLWTGFLLAATEKHDYHLIPEFNYDWMAVDENGEPLPLEPMERDENNGYYCHYVNSGFEYWNADVEQWVLLYPLGSELSRVSIINTQFTWLGGTAIDSLYLGWEVDFDIAQGGAITADAASRDDRVEYDVSRSMIYMWDGDDPVNAGDDTGEYGEATGYAGLACLNSNVPISSLQWLDRSDHFDFESERFQIFTRGQGSGDQPYVRPVIDTPDDYRVMFGIGPVAPDSGDVFTISIALCAGRSLEELQTAVDAAKNSSNSY